MSAVELFLRDVDSKWRVPNPTKVRLNIIGAAALTLQTTLVRGTKDSDVLETDQLTDDVRTALLQLAGEETPLHTKHRLYIEFVPQGLPFLAQTPVWRDLPSLNASLTHFDVQVLDIVDVVVSKLKRFNADDRSDIDEMIKADHVPHDQLLQRFSAAFDWFLGDARAEDLPRYVANLHAIERDSFGAPETPFEIPQWAEH